MFPVGSSGLVSGSHFPIQSSHENIATMSTDDVAHLVSGCRSQMSPLQGLELCGIEMSPTGQYYVKILAICKFSDSGSLEEALVIAEFRTNLTSAEVRRKIDERWPMAAFAVVSERLHSDRPGV